MRFLSADNNSVCQSQKYKRRRKKIFRPVKMYEKQRAEVLYS